MKKDFLSKIIVLSLILIALGVTYYFYEQGDVSFLPQKEKERAGETFTVQIPISDKEYKLSYQDKVNSSFDIANFEENESWYGDGEFDYSTFYEGESSLFVTSLDGQKTTVSLKRSFNIEDVLNFKFFVYLATDLEGIEEFNLIFSGLDGEYKFPIRDINKGWNFLVLAKENFSVYVPENKKEEVGKNESNQDIQEVVVELVSRPKTRSTVNLDALWAERKEDYLKDWNVNSDKFLSMKENGGLLAIGMNGQRATLKKGSAKDYTFQVKFTPLKNGKFGLFLRGDYKSGYGYYFVMDGVDTATWRIYKHGPFDEKIQSLDLGKGKIGNFKMEKGQVYWLKAETKGDQLAFSFSTSGKDFVKLGEARDESFTSGGIGITVGGGNMVFVDDIQFVKN